MPKIYATITEKTINKLTNIAEENSKSLSKTIQEMIDFGLKSYDNNEDIQSQISHKKTLNLDLKNTEYLLRILNISAEILRKTHGEPSKLPGKTVDLMLSEIKGHAKNTVETKLKNA